MKEYIKAGGGGGGKGKSTVKLPEFVEVCEQVKPFIDQDEDIPPSLLAKLLKFKLLHLKTKDFERIDEEKKVQQCTKLIMSCKYRFFVKMQYIKFPHVPIIM